MKRRSKSIVALAAAALAAGAIYVLAGGKISQTAQADTGVTTEDAATAAGARVLPTDPS